MNPIKFNFIWKIQALGWSYRVHLAVEKTNLQLTFNQKKLLGKHTRNLHSATTATSTTWSWWTAEPPVCFFQFISLEFRILTMLLQSQYYITIFSPLYMKTSFQEIHQFVWTFVKNWCTISPSSVYRYTSFNNYVNF